MKNNLTYISLFLILCFQFNLAFAYESPLQFDEDDTNEENLYVPSEIHNESITNDANFTSEMNFLENESQNVTTFLEKVSPAQPETESNQTTPNKDEDQLSLTQSGIKRAVINQESSNHISDDQVYDLINDQDKLKPRRVRSR
jgi:hypothetical protein